LCIFHGLTFGLRSTNNNKVGDEGAAAYAAALLKNPTLEILSMWNSDLTTIALEGFESMLAHNTSIMKINLNNNSKIDGDRWKVLSGKLKARRDAAAAAQDNGSDGEENA